MCGLFSVLLHSCSCVHAFAIMVMDHSYIGLRMGTQIVTNKTVEQHNWYNIFMSTHSVRAIVVVLTSVVLLKA